MLNSRENKQEKITPPFVGITGNDFFAEIDQFHKLAKKDIRLRKLGEAADRYWKSTITLATE